MGLDKSIPEQYWRLHLGFRTGDWGYSYTAGAPVSSLIGRTLTRHGRNRHLRLRVRLRASRDLRAGRDLPTPPGSRGLVRTLAFLGLGTPPFWLGLILLVVFFSKLGWLPGPTGRLSPGVKAPPHGDLASTRSTRSFTVSSERSGMPSSTCCCRRGPRIRRLRVSRPATAGEPARGPARAVPAGRRGPRDSAGSPRSADTRCRTRSCRRSRRAVCSWHSC